MHTPSDKANGLLILLHRGLHLHAERTTALALGDRSRYVGLSDIGRALECPRAALLHKITPRPQASLQKLLTCNAAIGLNTASDKLLPFTIFTSCRNWSLALATRAFPSRRISIFTLIWDKPYPAVRILELKSTEHLPDTLYASYENTALRDRQVFF